MKGQQHQPQMGRRQIEDIPFSTKQDTPPFDRFSKLKYSIIKWVPIPNGTFSESPRHDCFKSTIFGTKTPVEISIFEIAPGGPVCFSSVECYMSGFVQQSPSKNGLNAKAAVLMLLSKCAINSLEYRQQWRRKLQPDAKKATHFRQMARARLP